MFYARTLCLNNKSGARATIIRDGLLKTIGMLKIYFCGVMFSLVVFVSVPIYFFAFKGQLVPLIPLEIMFVDQVHVLYISKVCQNNRTIANISIKTKTTGFILAQFAMGLMGMFGTFATVMYGCGFLICLCNYRFQVNLIAHDFLELDEMWANAETTTAQYRYAFLCNISEKLKDMRR